MHLQNEDLGEVCHLLLPPLTKLFLKLVGDRGTAFLVIQAGYLRRKDLSDPVAVLAELPLKREEQILALSVAKENKGALLLSLLMVRQGGVLNLSSQLQGSKWQVWLEEQGKMWVFAASWVSLACLVTVS